MLKHAWISAGVVVEESRKFSGILGYLSISSLATKALNTDQTWNYLVSNHVSIVVGPASIQGPDESVPLIIILTEH